MKTAQGGARIPANLTRTGVLLYPQADGTVRREYRPPSEVFDAASMRTLETSAVTIGHPKMVTPSDYKALNTGVIIGPRRDGRFLAADIAVNDADALARVDSGDLVELSCGYTCELELQPGTTPDGEKYDAVQRAIIYNHVALLPKNAGRAGSDVRLRLDSSGIDVAHIDVADEADSRPRDMADDADKQNKGTKDLEARLDALTTDFAKANQRIDALQKQVDTVTAQRDELKEKLDAAEKKGSPEAIETAVRERLVVLDGARLLHGKDVEPKGSDREIMVAAIKARDERFDAAGRSDDYVRARFDAKVDDVRKGLGGLANVNRASAGGGAGEHTDALEQRIDEKNDPLGAVQAHNDAWQRDAWARPNRNSIHRGSFAAGGL